MAAFHAPPASERTRNTLWVIVLIAEIVALFVIAHYQGI